MEVVTKLLDKISAYQVVNYIIPGSVLCVLLKHMVGYDIIAFSMIENVIICYFVGLVNSRLGSLILRPILKKCRLVKDAPYDDFVRVEKYDAKFIPLHDILLEEAMRRGYEKITTDGTHLTEEGAAVIAEKWLEETANWLDKQREIG